MSHTIYQALPPPSTIRLLEVKAEDSGSVIECHLIEVQFTHDACPAYEALSYVWGSMATPRSITLNNHKNFPVTESLYDALQRLRLPHRSRRVWVDAICINQADITERSQQVRIMRDIFATASKVCVWLGHDVDGDAERASVLMTTIVQTCDGNAWNRGRRWHDLPAEKRTQYADLPLLGRYGDLNANTNSETDLDSDSIVLYWQALRNFYSRSWFKRVWCVQEIVVARDSIVMLGDVDIPWRVVEVTAMWLNSQQIHYDFNVPSLLEGIDAYIALMMCEASDPSLRSTTLIDALRTFQDCRATDPRDKVYALLGIVEDRRLADQVRIDYTSSAAQVYVDIVEVALDTQRDLLVLACVAHPDTFESDAEFPSWTPRWDTMVANCTKITTDINADEYDWKASSGRTLDDFSIDRSSGILSLAGSIFDSVDFISNKMDYTDFGFDSPTSTTTSNPSEILSLWRDFVHPHLTTPDRFSKIAALAFALTCETDIDYDHVMDLAEVEDRTQFLTDFLAYITHLHDVEEEADTRPADKTEVEDTRPHTFPIEDGNWEAFNVAASRMCDQRRFFMTSRGFMGLGPASTQKGDVVVVLFGGRVPFMLRMTDEEFPQTPTVADSQVVGEVSKEYFLLGEAFVQDIMRGEVIDGLEEAMYVEERFNIR